MAVKGSPLHPATVHHSLMPRYFFNAHIGDDVIPDVEGEDLRDTDHAWEVAKAMILGLLEDQGLGHRSRRRAGHIRSVP